MSAWARAWAVAALAGLGLAVRAGTAAAEAAPPVARFALVVGVNQSADPAEPLLRYADDDAALYFELFRSLGARAYLVTRLDDNTRRLHSQAAAEAGAPRRAAFDQTTAQLQAGVFSHEVRSGLWGAADADGDGRVSYREIAAFVERANVAIPNERFRPDLYARPPAASGLLLDLRPAIERHVIVPGGAHFVLESADGVRLADLHGTAGHTLRVGPQLAPPLYLREAGSALEFQIPAAPDGVALSMLEPGVARVAERGAAHEAFSKLFSQPFDTSVVADYRFRPLPEAGAETPGDKRLARLRTAGWAQLAVAGAALTTGAALSFSALALRQHSIAGLSHAQATARNAQIASRNLGAVVLYGTTAALAVSGAALLLLPRLRPSFSLALGPSGGTIVWAHAF